LKLPVVGKNFATFMAKKIHSSLVFDMAKLEGTPFTYPEIQTLLDGVAVGGHKLSDQEQVLRISGAWRFLILLVENDRFELSKKLAVVLNSRITTSKTLDIDSLEEEKLGSFFRQFASGTSAKCFPDTAFEVFLQLIAKEFFCVGNELTAQLLMNGVLLKEGYLPVSIHVARQLQYHEAMTCFQERGNMEKLKTVLNICAEEMVTPFVDEQD